MQGSAAGLVGPGAIVHAVRQNGLLEKDQYYTVREIFQDTKLMCTIDTHLVLEEVPGVFHKKNFRVDYCCLERMLHQSNVRS
jgi:hypothetical protein